MHIFCCLYRIQLGIGLKKLWIHKGDCLLILVIRVHFPFLFLFLSHEEYIYVAVDLYCHHWQLSGKASPFYKNNKGLIPSCSADGRDLGRDMRCMSIYQSKNQKNIYMWHICGS